MSKRWRQQGKKLSPFQEFCVATNAAAEPQWKPPYPSWRDHRVSKLGGVATPEGVTYPCGCVNHEGVWTLCGEHGP